ncbi:MAG: hypothetical protein ACYDHH_12135 [Solirubrobacteraceae bacterium]
MGTAATLAVTFGTSYVLDPFRYNEWSLCFTVSSLIFYMEFGASVLANSLAARHENWPTLAASRLTVRAVLPAWLGGVALASGFGAAIPLLYPGEQHSSSLRTAAILAFLCVGNIAFLIGNITWGEAIGRRKRLRQAFIASAAGRVAMPVATIVLVSVGGLVVGAAAFCAVNLVVAVVAAAACRTSGRSAGVTVGRDVARSEVSGLRSRMRLLAYMVIGMILVSGLDGSIVGKVDFSKVGAYAAAAAVVNAITGTVSAICLPMIRDFSSPGSTVEENRHAVLAGARLNMTVVTLVCVGVTGFAPLLFLVALRADLRSTADGVLPVLAAGVLLRQMPVPLMFLGLSQPDIDRRLRWSPIAEGVSNFAFSVGLGTLFGAVGVAAGTLAAALIGIAIMIPVLTVALNGVVGIRQYLRACAPPLALAAIGVAAICEVSGRLLHIAV